MKNFAVLGLLVLIAAFALTGCEDAAEVLDVSGIMYESGDIDDWNDGGSTYYRSELRPYTEATPDMWDGGAAMAEFSVVSYVDPEEDLVHDEFLMVKQQYGNTIWNWRFYGTDNDFAVDDTVKVSFDLWVPALDEATDNGCWFEVYAIGDAYGSSKAKDLDGDGTVQDDERIDNVAFDFDQDGTAEATDGVSDYRIVKHDAGWGDDTNTGSGGWVTLESDSLTVDADGVVDVIVAFGFTSTMDPEGDGPDGTMTAYFDNLSVTKQ